MATTHKGHIELLPSGSYRVQVYFGTDPVTGKARRVKRTVKTEANAAGELANLLRAAEAENALDDAATLALALERYLEITDLSVSTRATNETYIRRVLLPVLGHVKLRKIGPDSLDALYAHLRLLAAVRAVAEGRALRRRGARLRQAVRPAARSQDHPPACV